MPSLWGFHAALSTILEFGQAGIEQHILNITATLRDGLRSIAGFRIVTDFPDQERAGIVTVALPDSWNANDVFKRILAQKVTIALRQGQLRYSPHFYCSADDMSSAISATRNAVRS